jgi:protoporphyrinogen oxidase
VIIGAGPAGLTAAYALKLNGLTSCIIEQDSQVGGLAKTVCYKGYRFDIGGHRFFTKLDEIERLWQTFLGRDFLRVSRLSRIYYRGTFYDYPLQLPATLARLGLAESLLILFSYLRAQLFPIRPEPFFDQYICNRFGKRLFAMFFQSYTEKVWGIPCSEIRAEWAAQRIKDLSLFAAVRQALLGRSRTGIKSLIEEFRYPRLGPGDLWNRVAADVTAAGSALLLNSEVAKICHDGQRIHELWHEHSGGYHSCPIDHLFSSMPLRTFLQRLYPAPPEDILHAAAQLRYRDLLVVNLIANRAQVFPDNWLYIHDPSVRVGRIQNYKNWSRDMVPDPNMTSLGMEYFCFDSDELWNLDDKDLVEIAKQDLHSIGLLRPEEVQDGFVYREPKAYPMYDRHFHEALERIRQYLQRFENLSVIGRNGMHKYNNQDHSMLTALLAVQNLSGARHDLWSVNTDLEYQELIIPKTNA